MKLRAKDLWEKYQFRLQLQWCKFLLNGKYSTIESLRERNVPSITRAHIRTMWDIVMTYNFISGGQDNKFMHFYYSKSVYYFYCLKVKEYRKEISTYASLNLNYLILKTNENKSDKSNSNFNNEHFMENIKSI